MTTDTAAAAPTATPAAHPRQSRGHSARRLFLIAAPVLAGLLIVVGAQADPAPQANGRELYEAYAADQAAVQVKAVAYHFGYALWAFVPILVAGLVRGRGVWLANVAGLLALLGISTMPGFILADFYDSAIGQAGGVDMAVQVENVMNGMWGLPVLGGTGTLGFFLAFPLAAAAAWRAGLVSWWAPAAVLGGIFAGFGIFGATVLGGIALTIGFSIFSLALAGIDRRAW